MILESRETNKNRSTHHKWYNLRLSKKRLIMVDTVLLDILRCPNCVRTTGGVLKLHKDTWFICVDCNRKYPIVDDIPVMLIEEGDKWAGTAESALPVPPPAK
jgi:uncharacterized protein YbaR (Trm112 family)